MPERRVIRIILHLGPNLLIISFSSTARIKLEFITIISLVHSNDVIKGVDNHVTYRVHHGRQLATVEELGSGKHLCTA